MKSKILLLIGLMLIVKAQSAHAQIKGTIPDKDKTKWTLTNVEDVSLPVKIAPGGKFNINITALKKGLYQLGTIGYIYLEPDYNLEVSQVNNHYVFTGKGSVENNAIQKSGLPLLKIQKNEPYGLYNAIMLTEPGKFLLMLDTYRQQAHASLSNSSNNYFKELFKQQTDFVRIGIIANYKLFYGLDTARTDSLKKYLKIPIAQRKKDYSILLKKAYEYQFAKRLSPAERDYLDSIMYKGWDINNELLFKNSGEYRNAVNNRINFISASAGSKYLMDSLKDQDRVRLAVLGKEITNQYIKDYFYFIITRNLIIKSKSSAEVDDVYRQFLAASKNEDFKHNVALAYSNLRSTEKSAEAPDFNYVNPAGKYISLKSLRGKYVYIDLWATWCGPCINQIPDLKKLEALYKDKNITFVSISADTQSQKQTWLNFVKNNNLQGIQLMADKDFSSDFIQKFGVTTIPRFLLIDPNGKVVENDAKRPSDPLLKIQLNGLLK